MPDALPSLQSPASNQLNHLSAGSRQEKQVSRPPKAVTSLYGIGTAVPAHHATQTQAYEFMRNVLSESGGASAVQLNLLKRLYANSGIEKRHSVLHDYTETDPSRFTFFPPNWELSPFPGTFSRMAAYEEYAVDLAAEAARQALDNSGFEPEQVTHLVISTCTGFFAPGPDVLLLRRLGLPSTTVRTVLGFMGCYAGLSALRVCNEIVRGNPHAVVLQVAVELCSLHYQKTATPDTMVANAIFSDGAAAAVYGCSAVAESAGSPMASIAATHSDISADSLDRMSWRVGDHGFIMTLDAGVPAILESAAPPFLAALAAEAELEASDIAGWAIHPGGRKIIESLRNSLGLSPDDVISSTTVLREYGNMSSSTILFVLAAELARVHQTGSPIAAMAFGPGLTMEGAILRTA